LIALDCADLVAGKGTQFYQQLIGTVFSFLRAQWPLLTEAAGVSVDAPKSRRTESRRDEPVFNALFDFFDLDVNNDPDDPAPFRPPPRALGASFPRKEPWASIGQQIIALGEELANALSNRGDPRAWFTAVADLPRKLARIFHFRSLYFVIDHFDLALIDLSKPPRKPGKSTTIAKAPTPKPVLLSEVLKRMIWGESFTLGCRSEEGLFRALAPAGASGIDFSAVRLVSVVDSVPAKSKLKIDVILEGEPAAFTVSEADCAGCPAFVWQWRKVEAAVKDWYDPDVRDKEKAKLAIVVRLRKFLPALVFNDIIEGKVGPPPQVVDIRDLPAKPPEDPRGEGAEANVAAP
jgi:hypothetical protein